MTLADLMRAVKTLSADELEALYVFMQERHEQLRLLERGSTKRDRTTVTCRDEILDTIREIIAETGHEEFAIIDVLDRMNAAGTTYKESTIRTHITSVMCANAPANHGTTYDDLIRTDRGTYKLKRS